MTGVVPAFLCRPRSGWLLLPPLVWVLVLLCNTRPVGYVPPAAEGLRSGMAGKAQSIPHAAPHHSSRRSATATVHPYPNPDINSATDPPSDHSVARGSKPQSNPTSDLSVDSRQPSHDPDAVVVGDAAASAEGTVPEDGAAGRALDGRARPSPARDPARAVPSADVTDPEFQRGPYRRFVTERMVAPKPPCFTSVRPQQFTFQSQYGQDWFVLMNFFWRGGPTRARDPVYLDLGANHYKILSNTWFMDQCLGWAGVCVEPNPILATKLQRLRGCRVYKGCVSATARNLTFHIPPGWPDVAALVTANASVVGRLRAAVPCLPVAALLAAHGHARADFMSLDVEGHEVRCAHSGPAGKAARTGGRGRPREALTQPNPNPEPPLSKGVSEVRVETEGSPQAFA